MILNNNKRCQGSKKQQVLHAKLTEAIFVTLSKIWMMIVEIKNFGPIESFTFDLNKDLHFIIGENGVGKSYASYCLYCVLKNINQWSSRNLIEKIVAKNLQKLFTQLQVESKVDLSPFVSDCIGFLVSYELLFDLKNSLLNTFSSITRLKNKLVNSDFQILIKKDLFEMSISASDSENITVNFIDFKSRMEIEKKPRSKVFFQFLQNGKPYKEVHEKKLTKELADFIESLLNTLFLDTGVKEVIFLPSSRSGLYQALSSFSPILAELAQNRFYLKKGTIELPALSEPLADYFIDISTINKKSSNSEFDSLINEFEQDIFKGEVDYDDSINRITYHPRELNVALEVSEASSMVAELAPIILILKYVVNHKKKKIPFYDIFRGSNYQIEQKKKTILFIEEPEAHLHPDLQIRLIEIFTHLMELGIKVIMTSHSDYMFNKLNNMILDHKVDPNRIGIYHMINTPQGSIINPEVQATEDGMIDTNFAKSAENLFEERMEILERHNSTV